jgi:hypothetical protein
VNANGSSYVPVADFSEDDNESAIGFHISGNFLTSWQTVNISTNNRRRKEMSLLLSSLHTSHIYM